MSTFTPHIIYDNDGELFIGYTHPFDSHDLGFIPKRSNNPHIIAIKLLNTCRTFEDFHDAMLKLSKRVRSIHHLQLFFRSLADTLKVKSPVTEIDFGKNYLKTWNSDIVIIKNDSYRSIRLITKDTRIELELKHGEIAFLRKGEQIFKVNDEMLERLPVT